jgi:hypothetical protein
VAEPEGAWEPGQRGPDDDPATAVTVAYAHATEVAYSWHHSMVELIGYDMANHGRVVRGGYVAIRCGTNGLVEARNMAVREFLADDRADWLFWIDTDMGFAADTVDRLFEAADPRGRPLVGALAFSQRELTVDGVGGWETQATPTVFDWAKVPPPDAPAGNGDGQPVDGAAEQMGFAVRWDYPANTLVPVAGTGMACVLIHRSVFALVEAKLGPVWYERVPNTRTGQLIGEDLSFCLRAGSLGIPMWVHTGIKTTHLKPIWLAERDYVLQRAFAAVPVDVPIPEEDPVPAGVVASASSAPSNEGPVA